VQAKVLGLHEAIVIVRHVLKLDKWCGSKSRFRIDWLIFNVHQLGFENMVTIQLRTRITLLN